MMFQKMRGLLPQTQHRIDKRTVLLSLFACLVLILNAGFIPAAQALAPQADNGAPTEPPAYIPTVDKFTIGDQDVLTSRDVTLHIDASVHNCPCGTLTNMFIREWAVSQGENPDWVITQSSDWVPYQAEYAWTLTDNPGVHYMAVWVEDNDKNVSIYTKAAADYADLVMPDVAIKKGDLVPYLVSYATGTTVHAEMTASAGKPWLFVWYPENEEAPNDFNLSTGPLQDFVAPMDGTYLFLVFASADSTYTLTITPPGGPNILETVIIVTPTPDDTGTYTGMTQEPLMSSIGMAPTVANVQPTDGTPTPVPSYLPTVDKFTIDSQDVLATRDVTLHIDATAHNGGTLTKMFVREWAVSQGTSPDWVITQSSDWVPYNATYAWTLTDNPGVHYMAAWVEDNDKNVSVYTKAAADYADLVQPDVTIKANEIVPYLVSYPAGTAVHAQMTASQGKPWFFVWYPENEEAPNDYNLSAGPLHDFTAPMDGTYLFLVFAPEAATYTVNITPAGGPNILETVIVVTPTPTPEGSYSGLSKEPLMSSIGMSPTVDNVLPTDGTPSVLPTVEKFYIDSQDVLTTRDVTLHISATAHNGGTLDWMYIREWTVSQEASPKWTVSHSSGWIPYQADYGWTLSDQTGLHYMAVMVGDNDKNVSKFTYSAADYADIVLPDTTLKAYGMTSPGMAPYLVSYAKGTQVSVDLTASKGNPKLFVWYPGNTQAPNQWNLSAGSTTFTAPMDGTYLFLVVSLDDATYTLTITPAGGPETLTTIEPAPTATPEPGSGMTNEPLMSQIGFDPDPASSMPTVITVNNFNIHLYLPAVVSH